MTESVCTSCLAEFYMPRDVSRMPSSTRRSAGDTHEPLVLVGTYLFDLTIRPGESYKLTGYRLDDDKWVAGVRIAMDRVRCYSIERETIHNIVTGENRWVQLKFRDGNDYADFSVNIREALTILDIPTADPERELLPNLPENLPRRGNQQSQRSSSRMVERNLARPGAARGQHAALGPSSDDSGYLSGLHYGTSDGDVTQVKVVDGDADTDRASPPGDHYEALLPTKTNGPPVPPRQRESLQRNESDSSRSTNYRVGYCVSESMSEQTDSSRVTSTIVQDNAPHYGDNDQPMISTEMVAQKNNMKKVREEISQHRRSQMYPDAPGCGPGTAHLNSRDGRSYAESVLSPSKVLSVTGVTRVPRTRQDSQIRDGRNTRSRKTLPRETGMRSPHNRRPGQSSVKGTATSAGRKLISDQSRMGEYERDRESFSTARRTVSSSSVDNVYPGSPGRERQTQRSGTFPGLTPAPANRNTRNVSEPLDLRVYVSGDDILPYLNENPSDAAFENLGSVSFKIPRDPHMAKSQTQILTLAKQFRDIVALDITMIVEPQDLAADPTPNYSIKTSSRNQLIAAPVSSQEVSQMSTSSSYNTERRDCRGTSSTFNLTTASSSRHPLIGSQTSSQVSFSALSDDNYRPPSTPREWHCSVTNTTTETVHRGRADGPSARPRERVRSQSSSRGSGGSGYLQVIDYEQGTGAYSSLRHPSDVNTRRGSATKWRCPSCDFDNEGDICQICEFRKVKLVDTESIRSEKIRVSTLQRKA